MYAVIATGGKQYRVTKDGVLRVEKLDAEPGATVEFAEVLLVGEGADVKVGKPMLKGGKVLATVVRREPYSSSQQGDMAIITADGSYHGWLGGNCTRPSVQREAAQAIGMTYPKVMGYIILPQAARLALPSLGNLLLILLKDTALASAVGTEELLRKSAVAAGSTHAPFTFFGTAALIYLAIPLPVLLVQERIEQAAPVRR